MKNAEKPNPSSVMQSMRVNGHKLEVYTIINIPNHSTATEREEAINNFGLKNWWVSYQIVGTKKIVSREEHAAWLQAEKNKSL